jgi:phage terminase large subunit
MGPRARAIQTARDVGVPAEQLENFLLGGYVPQPAQMRFHAACRLCDAPGGPTEIGFGGARGPGKTHAMLAQIAIDDCQRVDGLKSLLLRRVGKAVREAFEDLRSKVLVHTKHDYNKSNGVVSFPNGSRIILGHFKDDADIDNYLGLEYDVIGVEEATTLSASKYRAIRTCNRTSKEDWRPRIYTNANPGGIGHVWYKERFVMPYRTGEETDTRFIPGTVDDNVYVNEDYRRTLEMLTGWRKRAWLKGDWDVAAGQFFTNFDKDRNVVEPTPVPEYWPRKWLAMDYGWMHPTAVVLLAMDNDGIIYVIDEYAESKRLPERHAEGIREMLARWGIDESELYAFVGGGDMWQRDRDGRCVADDYLNHFPMLERADMGRISGAAHLLTLLGDEDTQPRLKFFQTAVRTMQQISSMQHDPKRPTDVMKINAGPDGTGGDDLYDALRYGVMVLHDATSQPVRIDTITY